MPDKLVPCGGGVPIPLDKAVVVIGRNRDCDIPIACQTVSGRHCELRLRDGTWWVRDLGSKNGTAVNGLKREEQRVGPNDTLSVGRQRFVLSGAPPEHPQRPAPATNDVDELALQFLTDEAGASTAAPSTACPPVSFGAPHRMPSPPPATYLGKLVPCGGGDTIVLLRPDLTLGRHPKCDICVRFASISGKHCQLTLQDGYWHVRDLDSSNGTWVDGVRCRTKCLLPNSVLGLAKIYRYAVHYTPTAVGPPPEEVAADVFSQGLLEKAGLAKLLKSGQLPGTPEEDDEGLRRRYQLDEDNP
jgi:adenylate cyclase